MSKEIVAQMRTDISNMQGEFKKVLPAHIPTERFVRTTMTAVQNNPDILKCDRQSILSSCMKAAQDGLVLDGREAALVPRKGVAVYTPMVAGITKLVRNSGELSSLQSFIVHQNDKFSFRPGTDEVPQHEPDWFGTRGEPIGVYAIARLKDGTTVVEVMSKDDVMRIGKATPNSFQYDPAKGQHFGEWWRKTVIRRISKSLPKSTDKDGDSRLFSAIERDDEHFTFDDEPAPERPAKRTKKAAEILNADTIDIDPETGQVVDGAGPVNEPAEGDVM